MASVKRQMQLPELKVGFTSLSENPRELGRLLEDAVDLKAKTEISLGEVGSEPNVKILGACRILQTSPQEWVEFSIPPSLRKSAFYGQSVEVIAAIFLKGSSLLCIHSQAVEWLGDRIRVKTPWRPFKFQRRNTARLEIARGYEYFAEFSLYGKKHILRIQDMSARGMAIQSPAADSDVLTQGMRLEKVTFRLDGQTITVGAKVSNSRGGRIGLSFERITPEDQLLVSSFVVRHLVQYIGAPP